MQSLRLTFLRSHETNRLIEGTEQNIKTSGLIGGDIEIQKDAPWLKERLELYNQYYEEYKKTVAGKFVSVWSCISHSI